ncbi:MAG: ATP-binding protein [Rhodospirillales bacterium]|nr:ATP-binding protein [Rhodospirillales bacterium]MCW8862515.1 ATP-binding protein [Rhodospirillales bacterium]MCW9002364.1 ATP-binding protein [Rhodospirillales bacterium]
MELGDPKNQHHMHTGLAGRRSWERLEYQSFMELVLADGRCARGETVDVSLGGVFLNIADRGHGIALGETGELRTTGNQDALRFPCKVVRVTDTGIGLAFHDQQAAFGTFVTHEMMLDLMANTTAAFAESLDLGATLESTVSHIKNYMQAEAASLFLVEDKGQTLVCRACAGQVDITGLRLGIGEGVVGRVVREGVAMIVDDVRENPSFSKRVDMETGFHTESLLCAPLRIKDKTIGALEVINKRGGGRFVGQDRIVLGALASSAATAIHSARQAAELIERDVEVKASAVKSDFFSTMSHELRTPLNAILGFAQILDHDREGNLLESQRNAVRYIIKGGERLLGLVNEILDLAQIESGLRQLSLRSVTPEEAVEECLALLCPLAESREITVTDEVVGQSLPSVLADEAALNQVLTILFTNALANNRPGGTVTVSAHVGKSGMVRFTIADSGPEIPDEARKKIFVPFARQTNAMGELDDTGIGLTIAMKLIDMMKGRIGFSTSQDEGNRFWIDLPQAPTN